MKTAIRRTTITKNDESIRASNKTQRDKKKASPPIRKTGHILLPGNERIRNAGTFLEKYP